MAHFTLKQRRSSKKAPCRPTLKFRRWLYGHRALRRVASRRSSSRRRHSRRRQPTSPHVRTPPSRNPTPAGSHRPTAPSARARVRVEPHRRRLIPPPRRRVCRGRSHTPSCGALIGAHRPCDGTPWWPATCCALPSGNASARNGADRGRDASC
jgi:hypothetical protein